MTSWVLNLVHAATVSLAGFDVLSAARTYWSVLQTLVAVAAVIIFFSSLDDLFVDLAYWRLVLIEGARLLLRRPPSRDQLARAAEKSIAIMVPAWREAKVIATMIANTVNTFEYERFHVFVGVYVNDPETRAEVERMRRNFANVHCADVPNEGPTSKADCLNWIVQNILAYEVEQGETFDIFLMHDAEDVVHPFGLKTINFFLDGYGMLQLPVLSMDLPTGRLVACHYLDEFAEFHSKDLPVRSALTGMTPSAGVATAFSREAMRALMAERNNEPFNTGSLTEDYDVAHRLHRMGFHSRFVRHFARTTRYRKSWLRRREVPVVRRELVATREYFPDNWATSVRQKARWMLGISYIGWRQLGWFGSVANRYFLFRDRKSLFTAPTGVLAYILVLHQLAYWISKWIDPDLSSLPPLVDRRWLELLVLINFCFLINRLLHRLWFTLRTHGLRYVWLAPVRMVVANLIAFGAFVRSLRIFLGHLIIGKSITWDKTEHAFPSLSELKLRRSWLGDVLRFWNHVEAGALAEAVQEQRRLYRPLGLLLLDRGAVKDEDLAAAFAEQADCGWSSLDLRTIDPVVLRRITHRTAGRFAAVPVCLEAKQLEVALAEPHSRSERVALEALLLLPKDVTQISWRYAPLSDIAFAVRWGWTTEGLTGLHATIALLRKLKLIDADGETQLWAALRAGHVRLGDILVRAGVIDHKTLRKGLAAIETSTLRLGEFLFGQRQIDAVALQVALEQQAKGEPRVLDTAMALGLIGEADAAAFMARPREAA